MQLPERLLFVDVETTGFFSSDRVVSLGLVQLRTASLPSGKLDLQLGHYIFDPGRKSHPRAEEVHGYSDWLLRHQDPFDMHAADIRQLFEESGVIAAHNASFDQRFVEAEFELAGASLSRLPFFCTMQDFRQKIGGRSGLNAVLAQIGMARAGKTHGAFEDAWMAMEVFLWLQGLPRPSAGAMPAYMPTNLREAPPLPDGALPRRKRRTTPTPSATIILEKPIPAPVISIEIRSKLMTATRATAVLMMWIARSDGIVDPEIDALAAMVGATMDRLAIPPDPILQNDTAAALSEIEPSPEMVDVAARQIVGDASALDSLGYWLKFVTYADGKGTEHERLAIARITEAFLRARR
ncbi:3'-5' exonuclease [Mesorhizobium sp. M0293]|uniref:3'-5' exonuclease n=1 Tax=Mesorhizobium sp. M0293 TaxID=2956930 RepID=UPI00333C6E03